MFSARSLLHFFKQVFLVRFFLVILLVSILFLADGFVLVHLAERLGKYLALSLSAATGLLALLFLVNSTHAIVRSLRSKVREGSYPQPEYRALAGVLVSSVFLLVPGFVTDAIGLFIYIPPFRHLVGVFIARKLADELVQSYEYLKLAEHQESTESKDSGESEEAKDQ